jgi:hypothetical protein
VEFRYPGNDLAEKDAEGPNLSALLLENRDWWRRGESNPRPQAFYRQFYILSQAVCFNRSAASRRAAPRRVTYDLVPAQSNPEQHDLMEMTLLSVARPGP